MHKWKLSFCMFIAIIVLTGCLYPESERRKNELPNKEQVKFVQEAVNSFQKTNDGRLPLKTKDTETPAFQKYMIDFNRLIPQYIAEPPSNSYENGGIFQYVIVNVDTDPTVRIFDLRIAEKIREIKLFIQAYGQPPFKEKIADNVFSLNFSKLGYKEEPTVMSPYTNQQLRFVATGDGEIYVDYLSDIFQIIKDKPHEYQYGDDVREILMENSIFVPAYSLPYTIDEQTNEPIFFVK